MYFGGDGRPLAVKLIIARQLLNCAPSPVKHEQARSQGLSSPTPTLKGAEMKGPGSEVKARVVFVTTDVKLIRHRRK